MKPFTWIALGATVATVIYLIINSPDRGYGYSDPDVEGAAARTGVWGAKQRVSGTGDSLVGKVKEGVGRFTGNDSLAGEGAFDQATGAVKDTVGKAANTVSQTIHDLNR